MWSVLLPMLLHVARATSKDEPSSPAHMAVRNTIIEAMNGPFAAAPAKFLPLLEDGANWCDPYPSCHHGKANISAFLDGMPVGTDAALLAGPMVTVGSVGGFMSTVSFALPGTDPSCLYTADQHISWNLSSIVSGERAGVAAPKLSYIRWVYNASQWATALSACLGPATAAARIPALAPAWPTGRGASTGSGGAGRTAELQAVKDYVVSLQFSVPAQALICDLLLPTARYCDPFPTDCAIGREGCRAMKGLPPNVDEHAGVTGTPASEQTRPASVRPLFPTGPSTGGMYLVYSSAKRVGGRVDHKLHHTWAIWDLAPVGSNAASNASRTAPAPMLASFDWFMPDYDA